MRLTYEGALHAADMRSGSEAGSCLRLTDFVYYSTLGLTVIKKRRREEMAEASYETAPPFLVAPGAPIGSSIGQGLVFRMQSSWGDGFRLMLFLKI